MGMAMVKHRCDGFGTHRSLFISRNNFAIPQGPQGAADEEIDEQNIEAEEQSEHDEAVAEIVPDFEDLIAGVALDNDGPVILSPNRGRHADGNRSYAEEPDEPGWHCPKMRPLEGWLHGGFLATGQGHAKMPIAFERGNQRFEVTPPVRGVRQPCPARF